VANARGRSKARPDRHSPAHVALLIAGAALLLLLGIKSIGVLTSEAGGKLLARVTGAVRHEVGRLGHVTPAAAPAAAPAARDGSVAAGLVAALRPLGIEAPKIEREVLTEVETGRGRGERWKVPVPPRVSLVQVNLAVTRGAPGVGLEVLDAWEEAGPGGPTLTMALGQAKDERYRLEFLRGTAPPGGLVAVVIDDFGSTWSDTSEAFLRFRAPLTLAVLPGYRGSRRIADAARARGFEVLLHLPMEPENYPRVQPGPLAVLVDQAPSEVRARIRQGLKSVGPVKGVSSHMGSMATTDERLMRVVLEEIKRQGLFFVDTRTSPRSVAAAEARGLGVPCLVNQVFLDGAREPKAIAGRIAEAMAIAETSGSVVVVGHGHAETLAALTRALPDLEARGLKLVRASELVRAPEPELVGAP
jgi:polysaccharide deacetylase 2 family uncharacterized protein YibQ